MREIQTRKQKCKMSGDDVEENKAWGGRALPYQGCLEAPVRGVSSKDMGAGRYCSWQRNCQCKGLGGRNSGMFEGQQGG